MLGCEFVRASRDQHLSQARRPAACPDLQAISSCNCTVVAIPVAYRRVRGRVAVRLEAETIVDAVAQSMSRRQHDHQIRDAVVETGDITLFAHLNIPDPTLRSWLRRGARPVVTNGDERRDATALRVTVAKLERRVATLGALVRLRMILVRTTGVNFAKV